MEIKPEVIQILTDIKSQRMLPNEFKIQRIIEGTLNIAYIIGLNNIYSFVLLRRKKFEEAEALPWINKELTSIGFFDLNTYRFRNFKEQSDFAKKISELGLIVPKIIIHNDDENFMLVEYSEGQLYKDYLNSLHHKHDSEKIIDKYLSDIKEANENGMIIGNRWGPNETVTIDGNLSYFDFKYEYSGNTSKEFEISQAIYYTVARISNSNSPDLAKQILIKYISPEFLGSVYNHTVVRKFVYNHANYFLSFGSPDDGGAQPWIIDAIKE